jgi:hypothetical protein
VVEAGVGKGEARAVLFIGAQGKKRQRPAGTGEGCHDGDGGCTAPGTRPHRQAASTVS